MLLIKSTFDLGALSPKLPLNDMVDLGPMVSYLKSTNGEGSLSDNLKYVGKMGRLPRETSDFVL